MEKILYLECTSGISGDMTVGALLDLGVDRKAFQKALDSLEVDGYHLHFGRVKKCGIDAFDFDVHLQEEAHPHGHGHVHGQEHSHAHGHSHSHEHSHDHEHGHSHAHVHRNLADILEIIGRLDASPRAKQLAETMFRIVAEAEAKAHGLPIEEVHFHEVGAVDSIVDIVGTAVCIDLLNPDRIIVSPLREGSGYVTCQHGVMPVPVPATANIAAAYGLKLIPTENEGEMVTPTGAAIAAALHCGQPLPKACTIQRIGIGAGKKEFANANILRAMLLSAQEEEGERKKDGSEPASQDAGGKKSSGWESDRMVKMETNIDDCSGEALGFAMEQLLAAGAADVWYAPIYMKKGRPAYQLQLLCRPEQTAAMEEIIFRHTTTIGIRRYPVERTVLERSLRTVNTPWGSARVKLCRFQQQTLCYPEYEDVADICRRSGQSYQAVYQAICSLCGETL